MHYEQLQNLSPPEFQRYCGVSPTTFQAMVEILRQDLQQRLKPGGPPKLSLENQLLVTLQYWREYRPYFHIAQAWGLHESTVYRIVHKVENILMASGLFSLPGKRKLLQPDTEFEVVVVDVGEHPIERPKKTEKVL